MGKNRKIKTYMVLTSMLASFGPFAQPLKAPKKKSSEIRLESQGFPGLSYDLDSFRTSGKPYLQGQSGFKQVVFEGVHDYGVSQMSSNSQFEIRCDQELLSSQCAGQINHYSLVGGNNKLIELASTVSCQEFDWSDYRRALDPNTCESRLNCATKTASRKLLTACVPDRNELNLAMPVNEYNKIVGHAILRNLSVSYDAERIQKLIDFNSAVFGGEAPLSCKRKYDSRFSDCSKESLELLSKSYKDYVDYLSTQDEGIKKAIANDDKLNANAGKGNDQVIDSVNRIREIISANRNNIQDAKTKADFFQEALFKLVDEHGSLSTQDLLNKVVSEISDNEERYAAYYAGPLADYLMGDTIMLFTMIEKFQKIPKNPSSRKIFNDMLKSEFKKHVESTCDQSSQFNLQNACHALDSIKDRNNNLKQVKFDTNKNRELFIGNSLDFMSSNPVKKGAFFIRACENTDMQMSLGTGLKAGGSSVAGSRGNEDNSVKPGDELVEENSDKVAQNLTFGPSGNAPAKGSAVVADSSEAQESTTVSSSIANAFTEANNTFSKNFSNFPTQFDHGNAAALAKADEAEKESKKAKDLENEGRALSDRTSQGLDSIQKEIEALKAQLAQKNTEAQKAQQLAQAAPQAQAATPTLVESPETAALKRRIADLEREMTKESEKAKKPTFDTFDDSVWSRGLNEGRRVASTEGSVSTGSKGSRADSETVISSGGGAGAAIKTATGAVANLNQATSGSMQNLSLVKYENQSIVVLPMTATTKDIIDEIRKNNRESFFVLNKDGSYTYVVATFKDGKPVYEEDGVTPVYSIKKVSSDKVSPVKSRGVSSVKVEPKVRELKELKDPATRKRELDEILKKTKK